MFFNRFSPERVGVVFAVLSALGFSLKAIFVKLAYMAAPVDAVTLLSFRMIFSLPVFLWVALASMRAGPPISRRDWAFLTVLGLFGYYGSSILDFMGLQYISAGLERLILFTYPMLTILIGVAFMGKSFDAREVKSMVLSYAGIGLAFAHDLRVASEVRQVVIGASLVFCASLSYAIYQAYSETAIRRFGVARFSSLATLVSVAATEIHFFIAQPVSSLVQSAPIYFYGIAMAVFSTILPVFMLSAATRRIGASRSVLIGALGPVLTVFFGWWLLDEGISSAQVVGTALVLSGVLLVGSVRKKDPGASISPASAPTDSSKKSEAPERLLPKDARKDS
ncbi:MAG: DMT family transporter [Candidatus Accumulibacter sp.]|jgi:drug/metabolite transporter (DMT)-like permease|nr:DMT family transporter [Accumulibacter sp.]